MVGKKKFQCSDYFSKIKRTIFCVEFLSIAILGVYGSRIVKQKRLSIITAAERMNTHPAAKLNPSSMLYS